VATRKYSKAASDKVRKAMHEKKRGRLRSGSGQKVTSRKQAIAIALSQARREGKKVPSRSSGGSKKRSAKKRGATKKRATKKRASSGKKRATSKRGGTKKRTTQKRAAKRGS
jgi:hypothetical protein